MASCWPHILLGHNGNSIWHPPL